MLVLITKASDDYYYEFKEISKIEDLLEINNNLIISPNFHTKDEIEFWDGFSEKDINKLEKAELEVKIYDSYVE